MARPAKTKLKKYMLDHIDETDLIEVDKVERYLVMYDLQKQLERKLKEHGVIVETKNGQQEFIKENPAINAWTKLESSMTKLLDTIKFKSINSSTKSSSNTATNNAKDKVVAMKKALL